MRSVLKRELQQYFYTPIGYVFITVFWILGDVFFYLYNVASGSSDLTKLFGNLSYLFMLLAPLITMSLFSNERRLKTDVLQYCTPTSLIAIVLGKLCAAICIQLIAMAGTVVYTCILLKYTSIQMSMLFAYYVGFFLLGLCYIAIGLFMSSLTESQIVAAVLTYATNMILQIVEIAAPKIYVPYFPFVSYIFKASALNTHYAHFTEGIISPMDIGYFIFFLSIFVALTVYILRHRQLARR